MSAEERLEEIRKTLDEYMSADFVANEYGFGEQERAMQERRILNKLQDLTGFRYTCHSCGGQYVTCCDCE